MSQYKGREATATNDWTAIEQVPPDALVVARFDYRELRETLEAVLASMVATSQGMTKEIEGLPPPHSANGS